MSLLRDDALIRGSMWGPLKLCFTRLKDKWNGRQFSSVHLPYPMLSLGSSPVFTSPQCWNRESPDIRATQSTSTKWRKRWKIPPAVEERLLLLVVSCMEDHWAMLH
ncbi:hypothetical protein AAFF_G00043830 [Aldrovandia affinis]|uniref:Uncharacterized protein n=1 Tax=Aldrovandia affinis TaxID=143900 RepID=A0AAD7S2A3_9TELE|nr:hypothetical protein AAFF_G00043830 [Aldrovandia affinis]